MAFDPIRAEMRFGCGLGPGIAAPGSVDEMLAGLQGQDRMARRFPIAPFGELRLRMLERSVLRKRALDEGSSQEDRDAARALLKAFMREVNQDGLHWLRQAMLRRMQTQSGFRERLAAFWGDHFTAKGRGAGWSVGTGPYLEEAVRPYIAGRFEDLLIAAVTHPLMLQFLNQDKSIGPNSEIAKKRKKRRGLNENLARELLELHTLGVGGPYTQEDVRELAELLTGLGWSKRQGAMFREKFAEPGAETIMGKRYDAAPGVAPIHAALRDLARHPATARHISWKLAVHFVADQPDEALVEAMAARYGETGGDLSAVYEAMLRHPAAWEAQPGNIKQPVAFMASALRALAPPQKAVSALTAKQIRTRVYRPLIWMGQAWEKPLGPDGWAEADDDWITPQGMAGRLQWALSLPEILGDHLPDPRDFVEAALGSAAPAEVRFAAKAAESRREGVALVLMSPAFQRQ